MWFLMREVYGLKNLKTMLKTSRHSREVLSIVERFLSKIPRGFAEGYFVEIERGENNTARVQGQFLEAMLKNLEAFAPERERYRSPRVQFQPYTSSIKNYIVRFHVYTSTVDYLKYYQDILRYLKYLTGEADVMNVPKS